MMARDKLKRPPTSGTRHGNGSGVGGPANGEGWGGPAKGASAAQRKPISGPGPGRGHTSLTGEQRRQRQEQRREEMLDLYYTFASNPKKPDGTRIASATHLLNRIDGLPVAKVETSETGDFSNMTLEELEVEREKLQRKMWVSRKLRMTAEELEAEIDKEVQRIRSFVG